MTKIHLNVKEKYKRNEKGLLKEKATAASPPHPLFFSFFFSILHRKSFTLKRKKPAETLQTPLLLSPSVFLKDLPKSLCI